MRDEHVIVGVTRNDVRADPGVGENSADNRCQAHGLESGVDLQGDPGRDEIVRQVQLVSLLLSHDQGQSLVLADHDDRIGSAPAGTPVWTCV